MTDLPPASQPAQQEEKKARIFFPNLDGLRFFCFFSVFLFHSFGTDYVQVKETALYGFVKFFLARNGNLGVNFFFVLSGFLITYLLLAEKEKYKTINVGSFYMRRILRIWPLFYACVAFGFFLFPKFKELMHQVPNETAHIAWYLTFLNNFDFIKSGPPDSSVLSILWSVAVEEQFYLVWPVLFFFIPRKYYFLLFGVLITGSFAFRLAHATDHVVLEHHTLSCISDMTVGGCLALLSYSSRRFLHAVTNAPKAFWACLYLSVLGCFLFRQHIFDHNGFLRAADRLVISLLFGLVIVEQNFAAHSLFKMSRFPILSKLGTYTYGLYCLHMIAILIVAKGLGMLGWNKSIYQIIFLEGGGSLLVTIGLGMLSYHLYEQRFLKLKERFAKITK